MSPSLMPAWFAGGVGMPVGLCKLETSASVDMRHTDAFDPIDTPLVSLPPGKCLVATRDRREFK